MSLKYEPASVPQGTEIFLTHDWADDELGRNSLSLTHSKPLSHTLTLWVLTLTHSHSHSLPLTLSYSLSLSLTQLSLTLYLSAQGTEIFLTHDWADDELGRNNHERVRRAPCCSSQAVRVCVCVCERERESVCV